MINHAKPEQNLKEKKIKKPPHGAKASPPNVTGIPDNMKSRYEDLSGFSFDDVRVRYNSEKPEQLQALAYTQGNQVYLAPGQERYLPHELGHVVQQKQGRVKPNLQLGGNAINDDPALEREADDVMQLFTANVSSSGNTQVVQRTKLGSIGQNILSNKSRTEKKSVPQLRRHSGYLDAATQKLKKTNIMHHHIISAASLSNFWNAIAMIDDENETSAKSLIHGFNEKYRDDIITLSVGEIKDYQLTYEEAEQFINNAGEYKSSLSKRYPGVAKDIDDLYRKVADAIFARYQWMPQNLVAGPREARSTKSYLTEKASELDGGDQAEEKQRLEAAIPTLIVNRKRFDDPGEGFDVSAAELKADPLRYRALFEDMTTFIRSARETPKTDADALTLLRKKAADIISKLLSLDDETGLGDVTRPDTLPIWADSYEGSFLETPASIIEYNNLKDRETDLAIHTSNVARIVCGDATVNEYINTLANKATAPRQKQNVNDLLKKKMTSLSDDYFSDSDLEEQEGIAAIRIMDNSRTRKSLLEQFPAYSYVENIKKKVFTDVFDIVNAIIARSKESQAIDP